MVLTVEPGIYIPDWGGVRIEHDIVVERNGARILDSSTVELLSS
jgi:Xaa-Pro aminopeptidase